MGDYDIFNTTQPGTTWDDFYNMVLEGGGSAINIVYKAGFLLGLISIIIAGLSFFYYSSNAPELSKSKKNFVKTIGVIALFVGFASVITIFQAAVWMD